MFADELALTCTVPVAVATNDPSKIKVVLNKFGVVVLIDAVGRL